MAATSLEGRTTCPFLLKLFYRRGSFHRSEEFSAPRLPAALSIYTFPTCSLDELAHHIASASTSDQNILPSPAVGTRLVFRLVYTSTRNAIDSMGDSHANGGPRGGSARFVFKDLGSVVLGAEDAEDAVPPTGAAEDTSKRHKTLADVRFVVGDYISCAILPPLPDGSVTPALAAYTNRAGEGRPVGAPANGRMRRHGSASFGGAQARVSTADWRRGEQIPAGPAGWRRGGRNQLRRR